MADAEGRRSARGVTLKRRGECPVSNVGETIASQDIAADLLLPASGNSVRSSQAMWNRGGINDRPVPVFPENLTIDEKSLLLGP